ncbi:MAG: preprotein translocase subunit SecA [Coriobacteriaceae bacterium]|nr:preprotein translocase subunit SecA [Coriobacteriaceae bacterium]
MPNLFTKVLSTGEDKQIKAHQVEVGEINYLEDETKALSDEDLRAKTDEFRNRYDNGETLDDILPEAFAVVREASQRTIGQRHFDVQLIGGMVLHKGQIAEMKTGEGKTLVSTLTGYLNAIPRTGVHIVTVNEYLAKRDSEWMGQIYKFLGIDVGLIQNGMKTGQRRKAYEADIVYGTNSEFGFDYLRDNMVTKAENRVQRDHAYAVVDEVDSILIDEARTPLIISGAGTKSADLYRQFAKVAKQLRPDVDFEMDESKHTISATDDGLQRIETLLGIDDIYADMSGQLSNHLQQALRAQFLFKRDVDYVVTDGEVKIVDEFTGRIMEGRRYSEGLHQAIEAKEGMLVRAENQTLATITLQNYFRLYDKLAGMTGTARTEDAEFRDIYKLEVQAIPPNKPVIREELPDLVYRTVDAKFEAVADDVAARHERQQPCLVGTISIENSERLSSILSKRGIPHEVLNAKHHEREAHIVAQAGRAGAVTIATNMAGRGTDILLGGNPDFLMEEVLVEKGIPLDEATDEQKEEALEEAREICAGEAETVLEAGGLAVIGTERHEARRIDNQLRGRSGRQGDPGSAQFYLSLEDDLMRLFGGDRMDRISNMLERTEIEDDQPIQAKMVTRSIESAQRQVESMHFSSRKYVLEYDDVMDRQRKTIYEERNRILDGKSYGERVPELIEDVAGDAVNEYCPEHAAYEEWDIEGLNSWYRELTGVEDVDLSACDHDEETHKMREAVIDKVSALYESKKESVPEDVFSQIENQVMLRVIDTRWMAHLSEMDYLKEGIGLRAVGQRDPLVEYKEEAFDAFGALVAAIYEDFLRTVLRLQINSEELQEQEQEIALEDSDEDEFEDVTDDSEEVLNSVSYSAPEDNTDSSFTAPSATQVAAEQAAATVGSVPKASQGKTGTIVKDKDDPYANVGRNDPCPCGSGKKFKKCHGAHV